MAELVRPSSAELSSWMRGSSPRMTKAVADSALVSLLSFSIRLSSRDDDGVYPMRMVNGGRARLDRRSTTRSLAPGGSGR